jgi:hypothetical protein
MRSKVLSVFESNVLRILESNLEMLGQLCDAKFGASFGRIVLSSRQTARNLIG